MVIVCNKRIYTALNKTDIYEKANEYNMDIFICKSDIKYKMYVFLTNKDDTDLFDNLNDYEDVEKIILFDDHTKEEAMEHEGQWYNEIDYMYITKDEENKMVKDKSYRNKKIKIIEEDIDNKIRIAFK